MSASAAELDRARRRRPAARPRPAPLHAAAAVLPPAVAVAVWVLAARAIDLRSMSGIGLVSVIPPVGVAALALLGASFCVQLRRRPVPQWLLLVHVVALVVMLYGLPAIVEPEPRFAVTWRHVGVIDTIQRTGIVNPRIDAYFDWPGFFALGALVAKSAGLHNVLPLTAWAPVAFELLGLAPLLVIMRALTASRPLGWLAIWCFYLANWVGQDYFSPQALAFLLYLVVLAALLTWLRATPPRPVRWARLRAAPGRGNVGAALPAATRAALVALVILMFAAIVASHQLTPFAVLPGTIALVALRRCFARGLPLAMTLIVTAWLSYMAVSYLAGHAGALTGGLGNLNSTVAKGVGARLHGDRGHLLVTHARIAVALGFWVLAALGALRRARRGNDDLSAIALGAGPFVLPLLQPYGGEIFLRIFLFSLPLTAFFVAALFLTPLSLGRSRAMALALTGLTVVGAMTLLLTRYGNEQMDWFSRDEVTAVQRLYQAAPPGSTLVSWTRSVPWKYRDYANHHYREVVTTPSWRGVAELPGGSPIQAAALEVNMRAEPHGAYLILTRSQEAEAALTGSAAPDTIQRLRRLLPTLPGFRLIYANRDGSVFGVVPPAGPRGGA
jgi:hypothetical protein